jgi:hypothetical protein
MGKYTKTVFPSSNNKAKGILDLMHLDVFGSMSSTSRKRDQRPIGKCSWQKIKAKS